MIINTDLHGILFSHARKHKPNEMCGVLVKLDEYHDHDFKYIPMTNIHPTPTTNFMFDPQKFYEINENHDVVAIVHSHSGSAKPSGTDISQCNTHKLPYVIVSNNSADITITYPTRTPLLGRDYVHGTDDCYGIIRDFYARELNIDLPNFEREDKWWMKEGGISLYEANYEAAGFVQVPKTTIEDLQYGDFLICFWGDTLYPNHGLIWLGSKTDFISEDTPPCIGERLYLHHLYDSLSTRTVMGEQRFSTVSHVLRHKELLNDS